MALQGACFFRADDVVFAQLGDGTTESRYTPTAVVGLSSGVASLALGSVRLFCDCCVAVCFCESGHGAFYALLGCGDSSLFEVDDNVWFAGPWVCTVKQRHGVLLGI